MRSRLSRVFLRGEGSDKLWVVGAVQKVYLQRYTYFSYPHSSPPPYGCPSSSALEVVKTSAVLYSWDVECACVVVLTWYIKVRKSINRRQNASRQKRGYPSLVVGSLKEAYVSTYYVRESMNSSAEIEKNEEQWRAPSIKRY